MAFSTSSSVATSASTSSSVAASASSSSSVATSASSSSSVAASASSASSVAVSAISSSSAASDPSEFTLISSDNRKFFIPSTAYMLSAVIFRKLGNKVWPENVVVLENYDGKTLEPVVEYLRGNGQANNDEEMKTRFTSEFLSVSGSEDALFKTVHDLEIPRLKELVYETIICGGRLSTRFAQSLKQIYHGDSASDEEIEGDAGEPEEIEGDAGEPEEIERGAGEFDESLFSYSPSSSPPDIIFPFEGR